MRDKRQEAIWRLYIDQIAEKNLEEILGDIVKQFPDFSYEDIAKLKSDTETYSLIMADPEGRA
jgi:hypothetical protein